RIYARARVVTLVTLVTRPFHAASSKSPLSPSAFSVVTSSQFGPVFGRAWAHVRTHPQRTTRHPALLLLDPAQSAQDVSNSPLFWLIHSRHIHLQGPAEQLHYRHRVQRPSLVLPVVRRRRFAFQVINDCLLPSILHVALILLRPGQILRVVPPLEPAEVQFTRLSPQLVTPSSYELYVRLGAQHRQEPARPRGVHQVGISIRSTYEYALSRWLDACRS